MSHPTFEELSETIPDDQLPPLDRADAKPADATQAYWRDHGYVIQRGLIPFDLVDAYVARRAKDGEYHWETPYMVIPEIRDLCLYKPLMDLLKHLIGAEMALNLNLSGWVSTERDLHQDSYLNENHVNSWYLACWFALDDIHPDSGPFEFVPGTHRWPFLSGQKVLARMPPEQRGPTWPRDSQEWVAAAMAEKIQREGLETRQFLAKKGDVLVWHARLAHRGSTPKVPGMERRALIAHYSAIERRPHWPVVAEYTGNGKYPGGGKYFVLQVGHPEARKFEANAEATS